jgi:DNA polymerase phi
MTGQEERDVLFARLFGFTAVIRSALLVRTTPLPSPSSSTTQASSLSDYREVLSQLIALGKKKSWLRESAWWTIKLAIDALWESDVPWKGEAIDHTINTIFIGDSTWSPEKVAMALKLQNLYPDKDWRTLMAPSFKNPDLLCTGNLAALARILKVI